jgi:hypothetical protein
LEVVEPMLMIRPHWLDHARQKNLATVKSAGQVRAQDFVPHGIGGFQKARRSSHPCVIDEDLHGAPARADRRREVVHLFSFRNIAGQRQHLGTFAADFLGRRGQSRFAARRDHHTAPLSGEGVSQDATEAAASTRDQYDRIHQFCHV